MNILAIQALLIVAVNGVSLYEVLHQEWNAFKLHHKKSYESNIEERFRMKIFVENKNKIAKHNQLFERGEVTYRLALNKYSDMLHEEFTNVMNGYNRTVKHNEWYMHEVKPATFIPAENIELPKNLDWRIKGAVTAVKDQSNTCMSCWAFSATGALEAQHFRKTGQLVSLSEQNLVDCVNDGCNGGIPNEGFEFIIFNGGIDYEKYYPYEGKQTECRFKSRSWGAADVGYVIIPEGNEELLKIAVATVGPVSIAIDASHETFQTYSSGIYNNPDCSIQNINHAMLIVGYGTDKDSDYWLVKNSYGPTWGDNGYVKIARNKGNLCGIASVASYPIV